MKTIEQDRNCPKSANLGLSDIHIQRSSNDVDREHDEKGQIFMCTDGTVR